MALDTYLLIGLGNPGREYRDNRHNVGFMLIDMLAVRINARGMKLQSKALVMSGLYEERKLILAKPQTYMNLSGQSVQGLLHFYKVPTENLLVAHDDLDLHLARSAFARWWTRGQRGGPLSNIAQKISPPAYRHWATQQNGPRLCFRISRMNRKFCGTWTVRRCR
jgi:PTH1 family peptidyl-tRNA hydrolase